MSLRNGTQKFAKIQKTTREMREEAAAILDSLNTGALAAFCDYYEDEATQVIEGMDEANTEWDRGKRFGVFLALREVRPDLRKFVEGFIRYIEGQER